MSVERLTQGEKGSRDERSSGYIRLKNCGVGKLFRLNHAGGKGPGVLELRRTMGKTRKRRRLQKKKKIAIGQPMDLLQKRGGGKWVTLCKTEGNSLPQQWRWEEVFIRDQSDLEPFQSL